MPSLATRARVLCTAFTVVTAGVLCLGCGRRDNSPANSATTVTPNGEGAVRVNEFLSYHPDTRAVQLRLVAGYTGANNTLNINGATEGAHTVTIPVGWRVEAILENRADLPHSSVVIAAMPQLPEMPGAAAFPGAQTAEAEEGAGAMTVRPFSFVASRAGSYQIVCAVRYHAQAGMWIRLVVSDQATAPEYTMHSRG